MKGLFAGHNWVYWFHIFVGAPLLMVVPIIHLMRGNVDKRVMEAWMYILIAAGASMIAYHGMKLGTNLDIL